jgi:cellulose synthase/poly-beta-1,6-N-acetylglucosamine synthase-like glycosyltransferase
VQALRADAGEESLILVVADNCTDATAKEAKAASAEVLERVDPEHRGKGFALAFGRDRLAVNPPDVVVVLDADCWFLPGGLRPLAAAAAIHGSAQAINLIASDLAAPPLVQISNFAMLIKNLIRSRATSRIGGAALLSGTGMAFSWPVFTRAPLATGDIVEDLGLGLALIRIGVRPRLVEAAQVRSAPAAQVDTRSQRSRWEHGFLTTALKNAPRLLVEGLASQNRAMLAIGAHLLVPPLALLFLTSGLVLVAVLGVGAAIGVLGPALLLGSGLALASAATLVAWLTAGRKVLAPMTLLRVPLYALWKVPIYWRFLWRRETQWQRTKR